MPVKIIDSDPVNIEIQDQTTDPLDWYFSRKIAETNISTDITVLNKTTYLEVEETLDITVDSTTGAAVGLWVEIWEGLFKYQSEISAINGNVLTLFMPVGFPFTTSAIVQIVDIDQNKDFTVTGIGEQYYTIEPPQAYIGDLHENRFMISMLHADESDSSTYGDIQGGLTNGIVVSGRGTLFASETGLPLPLVLYNNLLDIKTNNDWKQTAYDVTYDPKGGNPSSPTLYGTSIRKTFNGQDKSGVTIPIRSARNEATRALFRDDLSTLELHRIKALGHLVD